VEAHSRVVPDLRVAFRCDGDDEIGAGHVARCIPLATAFAQRGWQPVFVGRFGGLARWLLDRSGVPAEPAQDGPAGLRAGAWTAAVIDGYGFSESELCEVAHALPVAFVGEAARCPDLGIHIDYHADRKAVPAQPGVLAGPRYAPVDPAFTSMGGGGEDVRGALVTVGGSTDARELVEPAVEALRATFPEARILVASGAPVSAQPGVTRLPFPGSLLDVVSEVDVAVSAAGLTAYELACAGVATVLVGVVANQQRVIDGFAQAGAAITVGAGDGPSALKAAVARLGDARLRSELRAAGRRLVDGQGAARTVAALEDLWLGAPRAPAARR
jgi:UDP-2,4-diacetamido-2,4,6-trideoxy-beta-L-altropyranose hydrolase